MLHRRHWMAGCGVALGLTPLLHAEALPEAVTGPLPVRPVTLLLAEGDVHAKDFALAAQRSALGSAQAPSQIRWLPAALARQPQALQALLQTWRGQRLVAWVSADHEPVWDHVLHRLHAARWVRGVHTATAGGEVQHKLDTVEASAGVGLPLACALGSRHTVSEPVLGGPWVLHATAQARSQRSWAAEVGQWLTGFAHGRAPLDPSFDGQDAYPAHPANLAGTSPVRVDQSWLSFIADI
jgi:hypothetical protein